MKPHLEQRNEQLRNDYKKFLNIMKWQDAVGEVSKRYKLTYSTTVAIVFHQGGYGKRVMG